MQKPNRTLLNYYKICDVENAEKVLQEYILTINNYKKDGIKGIDYNYILNLTHIRLYLVLSERGFNKKADYYLKKSLEVYSDQTNDIIKSEFYSIYEVIELDKSVKWLKESKIINEINNSKNESTNDKKIETIREEERRYFSSYHSNDIDVAEKGLHRFIDILFKFKKEGIKNVNYISKLGCAYARLYLIEKHKGNNDKAQFYLNKSFEIYTDGQQLDKKSIAEKKANIVYMWADFDKDITGWLKQEGK